MSLEGVIALITAMVALAGVLVSVFTLSQSARKDSFAQLQTVVDELKERLKDADKKIKVLEDQLRVSNEEKKNLREELADRERKIEDLSQRVDAQDALIASLKVVVERRKS